jgi:hypothetical protein
MNITKAAFFFTDKDGKEILATIQEIGDVWSWTIKFERDGKPYYETQPEVRGRQFINKTRALQIVDHVLKMPYRR